jgi:hypothetical protein
MHPPLLYIHGFASSAHSGKAQVLRRHFDKLYAPSLSHIPTLAMETLEEFIRALPAPPLLIGSSLGGYYALYLSQRYDLPAVLINPLVRITRSLEQVQGMNRHYFDGSQFEFTAGHLEALRHYACPEPRGERLLLMAQLGDEVIDQRANLDLLPGAQREVEQGGSHAYENFESKMGLIRRFACQTFE